MRGTRIIPSRFPPVDTFERIAGPELTELLAEVESLTNDRLREARGEIRVVADEDRAQGAAAMPVMAAFTHPRPNRFNDDSFGVFYAGVDLETAVNETIFGREQFLRSANHPATQLEMRVYYMHIEGTFHDLEGLRETHPQLYDPNSYAASRPFGLAVKQADGDGIHYESVRHQGGLCLAVMRPRLITGCRQGEHLLYRWNGERITDWSVMHIRQAP